MKPISPHLNRPARASLWLTLPWLLLATAHLAPIQGSAATFVISDSQDTTNLTSLRGAILAANALGGTNVLVLTERVYLLSRTGVGEDGAVVGDLDVTNGNLTILGVATPHVTVDATALGDRVLHVFSSACVTLSNLVLTGGAAPGGFYGWEGAPSGCGGAVYNLGVLSLESCVVTNNCGGVGNRNMGNMGGTGGGHGGGLYNLGQLTLLNCLVARNGAGAGVDGDSGGNGGGLYNAGSGLLAGCWIGENSSGTGGGPQGNAMATGGGGGNGGGLYNAGTLILSNCTLGSNLAGPGADAGTPGIGDAYGTGGGCGGTGGSGAGLFNTGELEATACTINGNRGGAGGAGGRALGLVGGGGSAGAGGSGAGLYNLGRLTLTTCTVSGNTGGRGGAGGEAYAGEGAVGGVGGAGGGLYNAGAVDLTACTIVLNATGRGGQGGDAADYFRTAAAAGGGAGGPGGGLLNQPGASTVVLRSSLVALNSTGGGGQGATNSSGAIGLPGAPGSGSDASGAFSSGGFNLLGCADGSTGLTNGLASDQAGRLAQPLPPRLGPLQMNGGPCLTHALLSDSPAIDQGYSFGVARDQRGRPPYDYAALPNAPGGDGRDIGAFESDRPLLTVAQSAAGLRICWDTNSPGYVLESANALAPSLGWTNVAEPVSRAGAQFQVFTGRETGRRFFRLRAP